MLHTSPVPKGLDSDSKPKAPDWSAPTLFPPMKKTVPLTCDIDVREIYSYIFSASAIRSTTPYRHPTSTHVTPPHASRKQDRHARIVPILTDNSSRDGAENLRRDVHAVT